MKIGLISDTHGHLGRTRAAARLLAAQQIGALLHCGDIGTAAVLVELALEFEPRGVPVYAVLGNVDLHNYELTPFREAAGVDVLGTFGEVELDGHSLALAHGHDAAQLRQAVTGGRYQYVFTGHTHVFDDQRLGATRLINPGALYRTDYPTVAVLDLDTGELDILGLTDH